MDAMTVGATVVLIIVIGMEVALALATREVPAGTMEDLTIVTPPVLTEEAMLTLLRNPQMSILRLLSPYKRRLSMWTKKRTYFVRSTTPASTSLNMITFP
jgi:hypothetical protein